MRPRRFAILAAAAVAATETREAVHIRVKLFCDTFKKFGVVCARPLDTYIDSYLQYN